MKRSLVCGVLLFCGFLSLSVGQECFEAIVRLNKESLENLIAATLASSNMADRITTLLNQPTLSGVLGNIPASSSPSMKCEIERFPDVKITKHADDELAAHVTLTFTITISDVAGVGTVVVEIEKNFMAVIGIGQDGFTFKHCSSPPGDGNINISSPEGLTQSVREAVMKLVKDQVAPVIDQNLCDLVKTALEGPLGDVLSKAFVPPDGTRFTFYNMETDDEYISFLLLMSKKEGEEEEREKCATSTTTSWKPLCPMKEGALADVTIDPSAIENHMMRMQSKSFAVDPNNPTGATFVPEKFSFVQTPDGLALNYVPHFTSCDAEDPNSCTHYSPGDCSLNIGITLQNNELKILSASHSCEENTDSAEPSDGQEWNCQKASCGLIGDQFPNVTM
ncbi:uncharacterized protein LOC129330452 [Eublepharis macularius]|uniref:Uncharacterized protein LOC129330452 n=1 Tax=Eublepharis macularius TaxID=481883 RepID=A0AA97KZC6_EUBMA|nr:uncharacterized protein LOC129330452 [Eublepharis macularius]